VGLVTGACLASLGHRVTCVDLLEDRVAKINRGQTPLYEPGLPELLEQVAGSALDASTDLAGVAAESDVIMIAVGTPSREDGSIDLTAMTTVVRQIGGLISTSTAGRPVVVVKSTVVPGTTGGLVTQLLEESSGLQADRDFGVAVNPEFLTEGQAVDDFLQSDRIVVGSNSDWAAAVVLRLYDELDPEVPRISTTPETAEMIKYASNALLATMISFSNEIANLGAAIGNTDVVDVMRGVHSSRYLTTRQPGTGPATAEIASFLQAGCGYGGSCLPKDTAALVALGRQNGVPLHVVGAVREVNRTQPGELIGILRRQLGSLQDVTIGVLGLAFKPDTDDMRESPAISIIHGLLAEGARVLAHDPIAMDAARGVLAGHPVEFIEDLEVMATRAEALVLVTKWEQYQRLPELLRSLSNPPLLVDGRRTIDPDAVPRYAGIGYP
jgi:UDPglucose 6-dehydrogenase/GDP-mannose 6-dehydrogenase